MRLHVLEMSPFADKVERALAYKGLAFERVAHQIADYKSRKALNFAAKLPALEHEGRTIGDSTQIALYLEERFPERPLIPSSPRDRGLCLALEDWADESLYFHEMRLRLHMQSNAERYNRRIASFENGFMQRVGWRVLRPAVGMTLHMQGMGRRDERTFLQDVERHVASVTGMITDPAVGGPFLFGEALSIADIAIWSMFACIFDTPEGTAIAARHPQIAGWMTAVDKATR